MNSLTNRLLNNIRSI